MRMHRVSVHSCAPHLISHSEYAQASERFAAFQAPLCQSDLYRALCADSHPFAMTQSTQAFSVVMKRNLFGLYELCVRVNEEPLRFIIDTGAQISGIRKQQAQRLGLTAISGALEIGSVGAKKQTLSAVRAQRLSLGGLQWDNVPLVLLDQQRFAMPFAHIDLLRFDGILGWDLLSMIDFEMDTIAGCFRVVHNRYRFDHPNLLPCSFPTLLVRQEDGGMAVFGVDSGAKQSWLGQAYIQRQQLRIVAWTTLLGFGVHGREELETPIVDRLHIFVDRADIVLRGCISAFVDIFPDHPYDGVFGNEIFAGRRIRFVNSRHMLLLT